MTEGIVLWFDDDKGIGFIETIDGDELFVHHTAIEMDGFRTLNQGDRVSFDIVEEGRGPEAKNVKKQ
jgi:CspA family cold shock protein